jgi:hypothetical protein
MLGDILAILAVMIMNIVKYLYNTHKKLKLQLALVYGEIEVNLHFHIDLNNKFSSRHKVKLCIYFAKNIVSESYEYLEKH